MSAMATATVKFGARAAFVVMMTYGLVAVWPIDAVQAQTPPAAAAQPEVPADALGRSTPRGTALGFLSAARSGDDALARQYLNTRLNGPAAERLAHELFVVLDARLPPRLARLSDLPEGSRADPLAPNLELVGTISGSAGNVDIIVERVTRPQGEAIWLFSRATLDAVPGLYQEISGGRVYAWLPDALVDNRIAGIRLVEWLAVLIGLPIAYFATVLLNRILTAAMGLVLRRVSRTSVLARRNALPTPARLLLVAVGSRWLLATLPLPLLARQVLTNLAILVTIAAIAWLLVLLNGEIETYIRRRLPPGNGAAAAALLRVGRRVADVVVVLLAVLATLRQYGVDATPLLAGLGVGGIAVALAAQKTLENIIAGASLIFDGAVRVGDSLKAGDIQGTVEHIGLRSTRIRTIDRTIVSVPNGQIANMSLETFSARDMIRFQPVISLHPETTPAQLRAVIDGGRRLLAGHPSVHAPLGSGAIPAPRHLFAGPRRVRLRGDDRVEPLSRDSGPAAVRTDRRGRGGGREVRVPAAGYCGSSSVTIQPLPGS